MSKPLLLFILIFFEINFTIDAAAASEAETIITTTPTTDEFPTSATDARTTSNGFFDKITIEMDNVKFMKIENYIDWILENFPKSTINSRRTGKRLNKSRNNANVVNCVDFAIDFHKKQNTMGDRRQRGFEEKFIEIFFRKIAIKFKNSIRFETFFSRIYPEPYFCEFFILFSLNERDIMDSIRLWNVTKKSRFFIVIWANELIAEWRRFDDDITDITKWTADVFTHSELVVFLNRKLFKLNNPFQRDARRFEEITIDQFRKWEMFDIENVDEFGGKHMKVSTADCPPQSYWRYNSKSRRSFLPVPGDSERICQKKSYLPKTWNKNCKNPNGVEARLISVLGEKLNFTWHIFYPAAHEYGTVQPDNSEDGIIGELMQSRADLVYCNLWVQYARNARVEFAAPYYQICLTFLVPRPHLLPFNWFSIFRGFSDTLWISIIGFILFLIGLGWLFGRIGRVHMNIPEMIRPDDVLIELFSILTTGNSVPASNIPGYSFALTCWSLFSCFIVILYSSDLVSFLTVPRFTTPINTLEDFGEANLTWGIFRHTDFEYLDLSRAADRKIRSLHRYETYEKQHLVIEGINDQNYAVQINYHGGKSVSIQTGIDDIPFHKTRLMKSCLYQPYVTPAVRINSPFKSKIENTLYRMFETGVLHYIRTMEIRRQYPPTWESVLKETDTHDTGVVVLTNGHIYGAYYVLAAGLSLSLLIFMGELIYSKVIKFLKRIIQLQLDN